MRLIDADALLDKVQDYGEGQERLMLIDPYWVRKAPTVEAEQRPHGNWEYLKEHITEMRDADGELNQKQTCQFILNLMGVIEREGEQK